MRLIDADALSRALAEMWYESQISVTGISVSELINKQPTIETKQIKYFDEDEKVWKIGSVIVDEQVDRYNPMGSDTAVVL